MDRNNILIGTLLASIIIVCALWHFRENKKLELDLQKKTDPTTAKWLVRFAWSRTLQLLGALGVCLIIFISYDKQLTDSRDNLDTLTEIVEKKDRLEKAYAAQKKVPIQQQARSPQAPAARPVQQAQRPVAPVQQQPQQPASIAPAATTPPLTSIAPAQIAATEGTAQQDPNADPMQLPEEPAQAQVPAVNSNSATIEALYNPEKSQTDSQSAMDDIKKRYEDILVIHYFLKKCNKIQPADFPTITNALTQEMAAVNAPARLQNDILSSSQSSYNEIYANSPCTGNGIGNLTTQYDNYITVLNTNFAQATAAQ